MTVTIKTNSIPDGTRLYAHVVLDRSGSMDACAAEAVGGYNAYVAALPEGARVSLTLFDSDGVDLVRDSEATSTALLSATEFEPRGMTPLYDAIGRTVAEVETRSAGFDRVALVVLTDGYENASQEFRRDDILKLLKRKQEVDGWLVIYLGANQDAWAVGEKFGTTAANSLSVDTTRLSFALDSAGRATRAYAEALDRQSGRLQSSFSAADRGKARPRAR